MEVRRSREQWSVLVRRLRVSGQPLALFAAQVGVNARSLAWWRWRLGPSRAPASADEGAVADASTTVVSPGTFMELARPVSPATGQSEPESAASVRVELGPTCRVAFAAAPPPSYLAALVRAYEVSR